MLPSTFSDTDWQLHLLQFLCLHTFYTVKESSTQGVPHVNGNTEDGIAEPVRHCIQDCFFGAINNLTLFQTDKTRKKDLTPPLQVLYRTARYAQSLLSEKAVQLINEMKPENEEELKKTLDLVEKIQLKKTGEDPECQAFELMFLHLGLQLFADPKATLDILKDLHVCYEKSSQKRSKKSSTRKDVEPEWMEVLTELLLSMMSQSSRLARNTAKHVFSLLSDQVTEDTLDLIINVLHPTDEEDEDGPITFEDDDMGDIEEDSMDTNNNGNDVETLQTEVPEGSDEENESSEEENEGEVDNALRQTVKAALGSAAGDSDDDSNEEDSDMDDEAMLKFDDALSEAFRSMQQGKTKEVKNRKSQLVTFKLRTLDLVETFVRSHPRAGLLVHLISPLLDLMESGLRQRDEEELEGRATGIFHQIIKQKKIGADSSVDRDSVMTMLTELVKYSTKVSSIHMVKEVAQACLFLMRILLNLESAPEVMSPVKTRAQRMTKTESVKPDKANQDDLYLDKVLEIFHQAVKDYFHKKDCKLHHIFLHTILERYQVMMWPLSDTLLDCVSDTSIRVFLKTHACSMLTLLLHQHVVRSVEEKKWLEFSSKFIQSIIEVLAGMRSGDLKPKYTHELLLLFYRFVLVNPQCAQKSDSEAMESIKLLKGTKRLDKNCRKVCSKIEARLSERSRGNPEERAKSKKKKKRKGDNDEGKDSKMSTPSPVKQSKTTVDTVPVQALRSQENEATTRNGDGDIAGEDNAPKLFQKSDGSEACSPKKQKRRSKYTGTDLNGETASSPDRNAVVVNTPVNTRRTPRKKAVPARTA